MHFIKAVNFFVTCKPEKQNILWNSYVGNICMKRDERKQVGITRQANQNGQSAREFDQYRWLFVVQTSCYFSRSIV